MKQFRQLMRIEALTTAASLIEEIASGGLESDDLDFTQEEFRIFLSECSKLGRKLNRQAERLQNNGALSNNKKGTSHE
ncbi:hypothetical protein [Acinetobacter calcoaceticus]